MLKFISTCNIFRRYPVGRFEHYYAFYTGVQQGEPYSLDKYLIGIQQLTSSRIKDYFSDDLFPEIVVLL
jgi:hypothetical protein